MVCGGESIAATSPINLIYQVGATETIANADTLFQSYFTTSPTNSAVSICNTVQWTALTCSTCVSWSGSDIIPLTKTGSWNPTSPTPVVTTSSQMSTVYIKGCLYGRTSSSDCRTVIVNIVVCDNLSIALSGTGTKYYTYQQGATSTINMNTEFVNLFSSSPSSAIS